MTNRVPQEYAGMRLDKALALLFPNHSRSTLQKWLKAARVTVDDEILPQKQIMHGGETVEIDPPQPSSSQHLAEAMDLDIIYQDDAVIVLNKPAGLVVHPGAGNPDRTLMNGLLNHDASLHSLPRAGIVHRLDKDTSGLMVVARNEVSRLNLIEQLQQRTVSRHYLAVVCGVPIAGGTIEAPISRHFSDRRKMSVNAGGKEAISHYRVLQKFAHHALLNVKLETGRTHQIRVHMQYAGYPLLGDPVYTRRVNIAKNSSDTLANVLRSFKRQALHATSLMFIHPTSSQPVKFDQPAPGDMKALVNALRLEVGG